MTNPVPPGAAPGRRRAFFVDILRVVVTMQMISGHTLDSLMLDDVRQGTLFDRYTYLRGLVSVSFLFAAGFVFHLATLARFDAHRADIRAVRRRFVRGVLLILIGYLLRASKATLVSEEAMAYFLCCDVLQCIGVTLLLLEAMTVIAQRATQVAWVCGGVAALAIAAAPLIDRLAHIEGWHPLSAYFTHQGGSPFPLFPWAGFMFAGVAIAATAMPQGTSTPFRVSLRRLATTTAVFGSAAVLLRQDWFPRPTPGFHPATEPAHVVQKLAEVVAVMTVLHLLTRRLTRFPRVLSVLSRETLAVYIIHIVLLYRWPLNVVDTIGLHSLPLPVALMASACVIAATVALALTYHHLKGWAAATMTARYGAGVSTSSGTTST